MTVSPMLVKLMMMTTSPHDGEALVAIRKANAILASQNLNWEEFLRGAQPAAEDNSWRTPPSRRRSRAQRYTDSYHGDFDDSNNFRLHTDPSIIDPMFERALRNSKGSFKKFIENLEEWWTEKGFLTEKQYNAVKQAAER